MLEINSSATLYIFPYVYSNGDEDKVTVKYNLLSLLHIYVLI